MRWEGGVLSRGGAGVLEIVGTRARIDRPREREIRTRRWRPGRIVRRFGRMMVNGLMKGGFGLSWRLR